MSDDGPFCPKCAEPVSAGAEYCMHCYVDFAGDTKPVDTPPDDGTTANAPDSGEGYGEWQSGEGTADGDGAAEVDPAAGYEQWKRESSPTLDPDGLLDNTLTVIVGIVAGLVIGVISIVALTFLTESGWGFLIGLLVWLVTTAHLVRRRTVQGAISHAGYALALALLLVPLVAAAVSGPGIEDRLSSLFVTLMFVAIPATFSGGVGLLASRFVPEKGGGG